MNCLAERGISLPLYNKGSGGIPAVPAPLYTATNLYNLCDTSDCILTQNAGQAVTVPCLTSEP